jgi:ribonuclease VapC
LILDSSAIVAILKSEAESEQCIAAVAAASARRLSAANLVETYMVIDRSGLPRARELVDEFVAAFQIEIVPVDVAHTTLARDAFHRYGRGSGHLARLNFGDCFAYALARATGEPLLFVGDDFGRTDIRPALAQDHSSD